MTDTPAFKSYYFWKLKREIDDVKERKKKFCREFRDRTTPYLNNEGRRKTNSFEHVPLEGV